MTTFNRNRIQQRYVDSLVDSLSYKDLYSEKHDNLNEQFNQLTDEEFISVLTEDYPELLN